MNTSARKNKKILFVMQHVTPGTHMDYVYEMARTLREERGLALNLLIEKSTNASLPGWVTVQRYKNPLFRSLENLFLIMRARLRGTKTFYVHYSFLSAITTGVITRLLGGQVLYWNAGMPWQYERSWREEWYQRLAYKCIHTLVTGAEALREGYASMYGLETKQIVVIPNWIDRTKINRDATERSQVRENYAIPDDVPVFLFVHKLSKRKGAHFLPQIFKAVDNPRAHFLIAGDGPLYESLAKEFSEVGVQERVHLLGAIPRSEVIKLYQAAEVFVMPSEEEGSPHSLIEAMAYELPFVAFDVGGVRETATELLAPFVLPFGDVTGMSIRIQEICVGQHQDIIATYHRVLPRYEKSAVVDAFQRLLTT